MAQWTEANIPDQTARVALITGANSGIGLQAARALAEHGAHVVLACRTRSKAEAARGEILRAAPNAEVSLIDLDLSSLHSVGAAAAEASGQLARLDLLINNAGVMATPYQRTIDGFELQLATNHLGHAALTAHLLPLLLATPGSRVVNVSSLAHRFGSIRFDDLQSERHYRPWRAYGQSKLANLLFTFELQRRLAAAGSGTVSTAAHPGVSDTNLAGSTGGLSGKLMNVTKPLAKLFTQNSTMGALPTLRAAVDPAARGGEYFGPDGFMEQRGHPHQVKASDAANDQLVAARLWEVTVELTGVPFGALH
jgi:NAD(P)-dependent dehydrogenase (short-subunit alcohol dehydrogenase family)